MVDGWGDGGIDAIYYSHATHTLHVVQSKFFSDGRDMRPNLEGTIAQGKDKLKDDDHFYRARVGGEVAKTFPSDFKLTKETLERGRERYNIYCAIYIT